MHALSRSLFAFLALAGIVAAGRSGEPEKVVGANWSQAKKFTNEFVKQHVHTAGVFPRFVGKTDIFFYSIGTPEGVKYWKVDPAKKTKTPLFDHAKLLALLSVEAQKPLDAVSFQINRVNVSEDGIKLKFVFDLIQYEYDLNANTIKKLGQATAEPQGLTGEQMEKMTEDEITEYFRKQRELREQLKKDEEKKDEKKDGKTEDKKTDKDLKKDEKKDGKTEDKKTDKDLKKDEKKDGKTEDKKTDKDLKKDEKKDGKTEDKKTDKDLKKDEKKDGKTEDKKTDKDLKKDEKTEAKKGGAAANDYKAYSPDKKKYLYAYKFNLYLADEGKESEAKQLSSDGEEDYGYGVGQASRRSDGTVQKPQPPSDRKTRPQVTWSKDSKRFTVTRTDRRGMKELFLVDSIATPRPALESYRYSMPGEPAIAKGELYIGDAEAKTLTKQKPKWKDEAYVDIRFGKTSEDVEFIRRDRLRRHHEYCRVNAKTGEEKCLISEGFEAAYLEFAAPRIVEETDEVIWWSERSGWGHYYLYDRDGKLKNAITSGEWRASRILDVDVKNRLVYFMGNAREPNENVYYEHLYRVRLDGNDLTNLTPGDANHRANFSPTKQFVVDSYSRVDLAPAATLRDDKGNVVMELEKTDLTRLEKTGWKMPECFNVKAADGMTDLYGNMWKPFDFDANKKYPIIVYVYPGPQTEGVNHTFSEWSNYQQLAQLGFIVIQVGHRGGCPERSKAYHSFGYFNLRDYGLVDKKAAIEALAARHPWIDIDRVGIYGHSGGGFMSGAAMLQKPYNEFFKAAVASAGNHDNNIYNNYWSETYHGLKEVPVEEKKDGATKEGESKGGTTRKGFGGQRKNPPVEGDEQGVVEALPPPRTVSVSNEDEMPWQEKIDDLQKKIDEMKKQLTDALGKGNTQKDEIDALSKKMEELLKQLDDTKKAQGKADEKKKEEAKKDEKKADEKKEMKKDEAKKDEKKEEGKKTVEGKKEEKKDEKKDAKTEAKTRFDIKIPTNAELAANLKGHLMLVHGEIDNNVHPANTMRLADALIKANKRFDLLIIPGARHGFGPATPYFTDRMWDFFAEHLLDDRQTKADIKERDAKKK